MAIFIICGFMRSIPTELEETAIIDGCTVFQCFFKIILPIAKSSVVTVAVVQFINVWNDLLLPRIFLTDSSKMTLPVGLTNFQAMYSTDYVGMIAAVIITIIPSVVVYILLHKQIMEGMVAGAEKDDMIQKKKSTASYMGHCTRNSASRSSLRKIKDRKMT